MKNLYILGAGGHGKVVAEAAFIMNTWENIYFLDDSKIGQKGIEWLVIDGVSNFEKYIGHDSEFIVALGNNELRADILKEIESKNGQLATIIHPNAIVSPFSKIGVGTVVFAGAVINVHAEISKGCIINTGVTIDHECIIDSFVHISPGAHLAGNVGVGKYTWIGIGASIINDINIGSNIIIGAGGVVITDINEPGTYTGIPSNRLG